MCVYGGYKETRVVVSGSSRDNKQQPENENKEHKTCNFARHEY